MPPSSSSTSCPCKGEFWPSRASVATSCATAMAFFYSDVVYAVSYTSYASVVTASFLLFSTNCAMHILAPSFILCAAYFSIALMYRVCHSGGHVSSTLNITSSVATKGSSLHFLVGSLHTLMYMLRRFTLKSTKNHRLLQTVGDNRGLRLIPILRFISMTTQNILMLRI